ncbi:helix-turn-helix domain-containing protein [Halalkalicoccus ordinarius]|uniref:helix-turn-helix domain-containing protein n=1 Tax=Halalkalicoccus ordinarius TaxID=3116651 RepID=UPI00300F6D2A
MASVAEFRLPTEEFCLAETVPITDASFEFVGIIAHDADRVLPLVRATGDERALADLDGLLETDPTLESVECIAAMNESRVYRTRWIESIETAVDLILEAGTTVLEANTVDDQWRLRALFPDRESLSQTYERCEEHGLSMTVDRIYGFDDDSHQQFGLTGQQRETMLAALEHGYYDVPRESSLTDLAETLDISHQALSERLRRGHGNLVKHALGASDDDDDAEIPFAAESEGSIAASED